MRRGKKINPAKNPRAREEWTKAKKVGRPKQKWVQTGPNEGHWEHEPSRSS